MNPLISPPDFLHPQLSVETQSFIRAVYGLLLAGTLLWTLPHWRRFFVSERWGGYAQSARDVDFIQNPAGAVLVAVVWFACAALITLGWWSVWAALLNLVLCRYFFVRMRWKGVLRGFGAPGFMSYWLAAVVFLLEYTAHYAPDLRPLVLLVAQVDLAFIMLSAGVYKYTAGYRRNHGMEYGMVNPQWGYWGSLYRRMPPGHWLFRVLNHLAWSLEVLAAVLMLIPQTRFLGGLLLLSSFVFIATQIRLGLLCEMVIACCLIFFHPGSYGELFINWLVPGLTLSTAPALAVPSVVNALLAAALWAYLVLLPLAHAGLFYNFYGSRALPKPVQRALELYTNFFGIIIWRVFSADHTRFFILIHRRRRDGRGARTLVSRYGFRGGLRYCHVGESITVTTLFTTLKYYPTNDALFCERLLRYARTVACAPDEVLDFEYVLIDKAADRYEFRTVAEYTVDVAAGHVSERAIDTEFSVRAAIDGSPVREGVRPGSYVPLKG